MAPGQFISSGASDPVFIIGDLSTVWPDRNVGGYVP
jgi:cobalt-zinc-cadmium efflux system membrane fusion protein